jgi:hypothetical protein
MLVLGSYAAVNPPALVAVMVAVQPDPVDHAPSLIPSLIHLRPDPFGGEHYEQPIQVANPVDLARTQPHRLGKRVGEPIPTTFMLASRRA